MKNLKTTIITALLLLAIAGGAVAQEKWEYAQLYHQDRLVYWEADRVDVIDFKAGDNWVQVTMKKLNELSGKGWEVYSVTETLLNPKNGVSQIKYHLRRKKQ